MNASEVLVERLIDWEVESFLVFPAMESTEHGGPAHPSGQDPLHPGPARRVCRIHGLWLRQIYWKVGSVPGHLRPGRNSPAECLYDAKLDHQPVLAITGLQFHDFIGTRTQQDVALDKLFIDVCVYNERVMGANQVENVVHLACRTALAYRGVSHITVPVDFQEMESQKSTRSKRNVPHPFLRPVCARLVRSPATVKCRRQPKS